MLEIESSKSRLFVIAESQHGIFTTKQAEGAGYASKTHFYQVKSGNWVREYRGIYRLTNYPISDESELVIWSLWSRNRNEEVQGVYSHETALSLYDLSDLNPSKLNMSVPKGFRRNSEIPVILNLHTASFAQNEVEAKQGYRVSKPFRTIADVCQAENISRGIIKQAITESIKRGIVSERERKAALDSEVFPSWAKQIFKKARNQ